MSRLQDILESINAIEDYTALCSEDAFLNSRDIQDKVLWRFTIIGEAVQNLTDEIILKYPEVNWRQAADMRNFAVHEYFGIDFEIIWKTIIEDLPKFKTQIQNILKSFQD